MSDLTVFLTNTFDSISFGLRCGVVVLPLTHCRPYGIHVID